jgi:hypothetical protein
MLRSSCIAAQLAASQEGLSSMKLVFFSVKLIAVSIGLSQSIQPENIRRSISLKIIFTILKSVADRR